MKVRALELGYYNHKRQPAGKEFILKQDSDFSERWMEKVGGSQPKKKAVKKAAPKAEKEDLVSEEESDSKNPVI